MLSAKTMTHDPSSSTIGLHLIDDKDDITKSPLAYVHALETDRNTGSMFADECTRLVEFGLTAYEKVIGQLLVLTPAVAIITIVVILLVEGAQVVIDMSRRTPDNNQLALAAIFVPMLCHMLGLTLFLLDCWGPIRVPFVRGFLRFGVTVAFAVLSYRAVLYSGIAFAQNSIGLSYGVLSSLSLVAMGCKLGYLKVRRIRGRKECLP